MVGDGSQHVEHPDGVGNQSARPTLPHLVRPARPSLVEGLNLVVVEGIDGAMKATEDPQAETPTVPSMSAVLSYEPIHPSELPTMPMSLVELGREIRDLEQGDTLDMPAVSVKPDASAPATPDFGMTQPSIPTPNNAPQQPAPGAPRFTIKSK